jgi:hypothetical protein
MVEHVIPTMLGGGDYSIVMGLCVCNVLSSEPLALGHHSSHSPGMVGHGCTYELENVVLWEFVWRRDYSIVMGLCVCNVLSSEPLALGHHSSHSPGMVGHGCTYELENVVLWELWQRPTYACLLDLCLCLLLIYLCLPIYACCLLTYACCLLTYLPVLVAYLLIYLCHACTTYAWLFVYTYGMLGYLLTYAWLLMHAMLYYAWLLVIYVCLY